MKTREMPAGEPPADYTPWLGRWTGAGTTPPYRIEQDKFEALLALQGFPYAFVKLVQQVQGPHGDMHAPRAAPDGLIRPA